MIKKRNFLTSVPESPAFQSGPAYRQGRDERKSIWGFRYGVSDCKPEKPRLSSRGVLTYSSAGVNYEALDPLKKLAQLKAKKTAGNLCRFGIKEVETSRGESAYVWEEKDSFRAFVIEGLGTKNLVADETQKITGKTYYDSLAQDTIAMIVNDLVVVGAEPQVVNAYWAVGSSDWFTDQKRSKDLVNGWTKACNLAGASWGGGETPTLKDIVEPGRIDLAGSAVGIVKPKERLVLGNRLVPGDAILLIESSGIHANGLTLARAIASKLKKGYATRLSDGKMYGETLLTATFIYARLVKDFFENGIDIHYMVNITGHGWRKLMRLKKELTYVIENIPQPQLVFQFIQKQGGISDEEMYGTFNMGTGFAIFVPENQAKKAQNIARQKHGLKAIKAGVVEKGPRQVIIRPKNIIFNRKTLKIR